MSEDSLARVRETYVTSVDLLQATIDAIEHNPDEVPQRPGHPQDVYADARAALDVVTGERIARTARAYAGL